MKALSRQQVISIGVGFIFGVVWLVAMRFVLLPNSTHYHANFALYVNEEQQTFDSDLFYEEIQACSADEVGPRTRTHMHQPDNDVVHVHDQGVTWGNFFENIGFNLGNDFVRTPQGVLVDGNSGELAFILNGNSTKKIANKVINSQDRLLIDFGSEKDLQLKYDSITKNAAEFNQAADPSACKGDDGSLSTRFKRAIWQ